jgi:hypothetical protein
MKIARRAASGQRKPATTETQALAALASALTKKDEPAREVLYMGHLKPGETPAQGNARLTTGGIVSNAATLKAWSSLFRRDQLDLTACFQAVGTAADQAQRGDLGAVEGLLMAQILALNAIFTDLALVARHSDRHDTLDNSLRLALRAQGQCRATCETLATIKNPPTVFARQANITNGLQQVNVNNGLAPARTLSGAPNRLLEAQHERVGLEPASATAAGDSAMAPVGALDRPADASREGARLAERVPRRPPAEVQGAVAGAVRGTEGAARRVPAHPGGAVVGRRTRP